MSNVSNATITVKLADLPRLRPFLEAAAEVVRLHEQHGLEDERLGGAILTLETELGELTGTTDAG